MLSAALLLIAPPTPALWSSRPGSNEPDTDVAFRGTLITHSGQANLKILGASEFLVWLDGKLLYDGPARFAPEFPEYQTVPLRVAPGPHTLAIHARNDGVTTRILSQQAPFVWCEASEGSLIDPIVWKCAVLPGYRAKAQRISDILGWTDWQDTRAGWEGWQRPGFDDRNWSLPLALGLATDRFVAAKTRPVRMVDRTLAPVGNGLFCRTFGYEADDPPARFFLDDLHPSALPAQGVWFRYDLGRVRLGRPKLTIEAPAGTVVETALSEDLTQGRVAPWITLSGSRTCNMDHFVARGGVQELMPLTPKGGRYLEVHLGNPIARVVKAGFLERTYFENPTGRFHCNDPLLNRIWATGVQTVMACSEDALVDCPTRERGQWTGDVASVATEIVAAGFGDLSLSRRALVQAAQSARKEDGLVAGVGPGDPGYLSTYAAQWVTACVRYVELTGDRTLLAELEPAALRNIQAFEAKRTNEGVRDDLGWAFVDWGYVRNSGPSDIALDIHYLRALRSMVRWEKLLGHDRSPFEGKAQEVAYLVSTWLKGHLSLPGGWDAVGYQRAALALLANVVPPSQVKPCIGAIKRHLLRCFPNNPNGPRLSDPGVSSDQVMTPYFCHFAFAALLEHGETDFVLSQYRKCWGWALEDGRTTWLEVFDPRWSHCHEWSGCPTWQLTHYVLGLHSRFDLAADTFEFQPSSGDLQTIEGNYPLPGGGSVSVKWRRIGQGIHVRMEATRPVRIKDETGWRSVQKPVEWTLR